jgi:3-hydroxymyristoyl/3-hydroxydecanoyl-(acyl carrier protein) dehydratase
VSPIQREAVPHGYPCRLVERVELCDGGRVAVVLATSDSTLTRTGPWPATLVAEALAQAILLVEGKAARSGARLVRIDGMKLLAPLASGDRVEVAVHEEGRFGALRRYSCRAWSGGALVAVARITVSG